MRTSKRLEKKLDVIIDSMKKQSSWKKRITIQAFVLLLISGLILIISIRINWITANLIIDKSEKKLTEHINKIVRKEIENIDLIIENTDKDIKKQINKSIEEEFESIKNLVKNIDKETKEQIKKSTDESTKNIQEAIYPNDFEVTVFCDGKFAKLKDPIYNTVEIQDRLLKSDAIKVYSDIPIIEVKKDIFNLTFKIFNNSRFVAIDTLISFYFEADAANLRRGISAGYFDKFGTSIFSDTTPLIFDTDSETPSKLNGFSFVAYPIAAGNYNEYTFDRIPLITRKSLLAIGVRDNYFLFYLKKV